jgi:alpha-tubulin suppressor-like RCC1 family protein
MPYTTGSYKYARLLMSGFLSSPLPKSVLSNPDFKNGMVLKNNKYMKAYNINLFADYVFQTDILNFKSATDIFNSSYSGITFSSETGIIKIIDDIFIDQSGIYSISGVQTGIFQSEIINIISAGDEHSLYVDPFYGRYFGLGNTGAGRIGPQNISNVIQVAAGTEHTLILLKNKKLTGFGNNADGRVSGITGNLTSGYGWDISPVGKLTGVTKISTKNSFSLALLGDNGVTGWGNNSTGQISPFENKVLYLSGIKDIQAGSSHGLILFNNGTLTGWGNSGTGNWIGDWKYLTGVKEIGAGNDHNVALLENGVVTGWGNNIYNQSLGGNNLTGVKKISAGRDFNLALLNDNTITGWGDNTFNQCLGGTNLANVSGVYAGGNYGIAILNNGIITGWGNNIYNQYLIYNPRIPPNGIIYDFTYYKKSGAIRMVGGDYNVGPPIGYREQTYTGIYTGIITFNDYFYNPEKQTLFFIQDVFYRVEGPQIFTTNLTTLNDKSNNQQLPSLSTLLVDLADLSGYQTSTITTTVYGFIKNYPLKRLQISGFAYLTGTVSGIGTGIINFNQLVSGFPAIAYSNQVSGYKNATGLLNFQNSELGDFIILNNDFTGSNVSFIYQTGQDFFAPGFFKDAKDLNNIINSGSNDYGIKSTYLPNFSFSLKTLITGDNKLGNPENDLFGRAIHYNDFTNTLFIGAASDINSVANAGAVYIFSGYRNNWKQIAVLTGDTFGLSNPNADRFGYSISSNFSGNILAIGAINAETNSVSSAGAVYIFTGGGSSWSQTARLTGDTLGFGNPDGDNFGHSISLNFDGNVLAVGAQLADSNTLSNVGAAYIFTGIQNSWNQIARLTGQRTIPIVPTSDQVGFSVALNSKGDTLIAGAPMADPFGISNVGVAFIFTGYSGNWNQSALITGNTSGSPSNDRFGYSISLSAKGNTLAIGAYSADTNGVSNAGAVYIFTGSGSSWSQTARLTGDTLGLGNPTNHFFGISTSLNEIGDTLAVGADGLHVNSMQDVGAAYVFTGYSNSWSQVLIITGDTLGYGVPSDGRFGNKIILNKYGNELFVGAFGGIINGINNAGYVNYIDLKERLFLESLISGELGNNFRIISQGSNEVPFLENEFFKGGEDFNVKLTPLQGIIFTGNLNSGMFVTGYFENLITGAIEKEITGLLGYRPFTGLWDLYELTDVSFINIKNTGYFEETGIFTNYTGFSKNLTNVKRFAVSYTNQPDFESTDVALLNINLNGGLSGFSYNIILTGDTELNIPIIPPTGNDFEIN